jgi:hypothetical protein
VTLIPTAAVGGLHRDLHECVSQQAGQAEATCLIQVCAWISVLEKPRARVGKRVGLGCGQAREGARE